MASVAPASGLPRPAETPARRLVADFCANPIAVFGLVLLGVILALALLAPWISPQNPYDLAQLDVMDSRLPPGSATASGGTFWLGTDDQGRDMDEDTLRRNAGYADLERNLDRLVASLAAFVRDNLA